MITSHNPSYNYVHEFMHNDQKHFQCLSNIPFSLKFQAGIIAFSFKFVEIIILSS